MRNLRESRGITLIALIVTIIVLLILAGVTLSLIAGGDGILGKTEKATREHRISAARELLDLKLVEIDTNFYEVNLRKANFIEIVEKLKEDNEIIIVGTELGQVSSLNKDVTLPDDLNSLKAILVCSTSYTDVIFRISNEREITLVDENVDIELPDMEQTPEPELEIYTIIYDANGGVGEMTNSTLNAGSNFNLPKNNYTKIGYVFDKWTTNADGTGNSYGDQNEIVLNTDTILYAQWKTYNTDGLICWLDGEKNTESQHDATSTTWYDLSGNNKNATLYNCTINNNNIEFDGTSSYAELAKGAMGNYIDSTVEVVGLIENPCVALTDDDTISGRGLGLSANGEVVTSMSSGSTIGRHAPLWETDLTLNSNVVLYSLLYKQSSYLDTNVFINSVLAQKLSTTGSFSNSSTTPLIGKRYFPGATDWNMKGKIYSIRIYNRELTEAEIQYNYQIDKARFGI